VVFLMVVQVFSFDRSIINEMFWMSNVFRPANMN
jgi:hypothetical protein